MTRRHLSILILLLMVSLSAGLLIWAFTRRNSLLVQIRQIPTISAIRLSGEDIKTSDILVGGKRIVLFFFHPECEYCRKELAGVWERHTECPEAQWLFITLAPIDEVEDYLLTCPLDSIPNAHVLTQETPETFVLYNVKGPPAVFIYDDEGFLRITHRGATSIDDLIKEIKRL